MYHKETPNNGNRREKVFADPIRHSREEPAPFQNEALIQGFGRVFLKMVRRAHYQRNHLPFTLSLS